MSRTVCKKLLDIDLSELHIEREPAKGWWIAYFGEGDASSGVEGPYEHIEDLFAALLCELPSIQHEYEDSIYDEWVRPS